MKIAVVTEDEKAISTHLGHTSYYLVFTVEDGEITEKESRNKIGHRQFANEPGHHKGHADSQGHGFGRHSEEKHARMIEAIKDCQVVIARGMGRGTHLAMEQANIRPYVTDITDAEDAVRAYIDGNLVDHTDKLH